MIKKNKWRVKTCTYLNQKVLQILNANGEWSCLHNDNLDHDAYDIIMHEYDFIKENGDANIHKHSLLLHKYNNNQIWTVIEEEYEDDEIRQEESVDVKLYLCEGIKIVNSLYYKISKKSHTNKKKMYLINL